MTTFFKLIFANKMLMAHLISSLGGLTKLLALAEEAEKNSKIQILPMKENLQLFVENSFDLTFCRHLLMIICGNIDVGIQFLSQKRKLTEAEKKEFKDFNLSFDPQILQVCPKNILHNLLVYIDYRIRLIDEISTVSLDEVDFPEEVSKLQTLSHYVMGVIGDLNPAEPLHLVSQKLEASINAIHEKREQNETMHPFYYDDIISHTDIAFTKLLILCMRLEPDAKENWGIEADVLIAKVQKIQNKARSNFYKIPPTLRKPSQDDSEQKMRKETFKELELELFTKEDLNVRTSWTELKEKIKKQLKPQPSALPAPRAQEQVGEDDTYLQDSFNSWIETHPKTTQALKEMLQNCQANKLGKDIKDALEMGLLERTKCLGLILLDQILIKKADVATLLVHFQKEPSSESEEKAAYEIKHKLDALVVVFGKLQADKENAYNIEKIAKLLVLSQESCELTKEEQEALKLFNDLIAKFSIDAQTFNALNRFLIQKIVSPVTYEEHAIQLDRFRAQQMFYEEEFGDNDEDYSAYVEDIE